MNLETQTDAFFRNDGGFFVDHTGEVGLGAASRSSTRFGVGLVNFNNDGRLDLYHANGRVTQAAEPLASEPIAHVGLGDATRVEEVTVHWPDGTWETFGGFDAGAVETLRRGTGTGR